MRNIIDELVVKYDMLEIIQGLNYFMIGNTLTLDTVTLQKGFKPDDDLVGKYIRLGFCCVAINDSLKSYHDKLDDAIHNDLRDVYDLLIEQSESLAIYMINNRARIHTDVVTDHITIVNTDDKLRIEIDEFLMDLYAGVIIDYIDKALDTYGFETLTERSNSMVKEYNMICELSNRIENDSHPVEV